MKRERGWRRRDAVGAEGEGGSDPDNISVGGLSQGKYKGHQWESYAFKENNEVECG